MNLGFKIKLNKNKELRFNFNISRNQKADKNKQTLKDVSYKVFCIGIGKTGTTSLGKALVKMGFELGNQAVAETLAEDWGYKKSGRIIRFCETANAFQDIPFAMPGLYKELDNAFPESKFILTIRDDENQWFNSLVKFHIKRFSSDKDKTPSEKDLANSLYRYKGWSLDMKKIIWNYPDVELYDEKYYKERYLKHNNDVIRYFDNRLDDLLVLNVAEKDSYQKLAKFLNIKVDKDEQFPWLNKT